MYKSSVSRVYSISLAPFPGLPRVKWKLRCLCNPAYHIYTSLHPERRLGHGHGPEGPLSGKHYCTVSTVLRKYEVLYKNCSFNLQREKRQDLSGWKLSTCIMNCYYSCHFWHYVHSAACKEDE